MSRTPLVGEPADVRLGVDDSDPLGEAVAEEEHAGHLGSGRDKPGPRIPKAEAIGKEGIGLAPPQGGRASVGSEIMMVQGAVYPVGAGQGSGIPGGEHALEDLRRTDVQHRIDAERNQNVLEALPYYRRAHGKNVLSPGASRPTQGCPRHSWKANQRPIPEAQVGEAGPRMRCHSSSPRGVSQATTEASSGSTAPDRPSAR